MCFFYSKQRITLNKFILSALQVLPNLILIFPKQVLLSIVIAIPTFCMRELYISGDMYNVIRCQTQDPNTAQTAFWMSFIRYFSLRIF